MTEPTQIEEAMKSWKITERQRLMAALICGPHTFTEADIGAANALSPQDHYFITLAAISKLRESKLEARDDR